MAPLVKEFQKRRSEFITNVCVTAQHRQMLDEVLGVFRITPDHDLNIMQDGQTLYHITSAALCRMEQVLTDEKPDMVLVHGDTTTTFAASLAAFYQKIPVGHVEAGLRSYNRRHPFPEEANRLLTDAICDLYFAPTSTSRKALLRENMSADRIFVTGNTVIDALYMALAQKRPFNAPQLKQLFAPSKTRSQSRLILVTAHRRENFGKPLENAFTALRRVAERYEDVRIVYPVHLNPNVQEPAKRILGNVKNIHLLPPVNYPDLANLIQRATLVVTDSGGLQEEAPSLGKPVLVLREVTERPEAVKAGTVKIVGTDEKKVFGEICRTLENRRQYEKMARAVNPYGDGKACSRTVEAVRYYFGFRSARPSEFKSK
jgi:UDP-N-acetylglucosamine 2-epimerase (non-hydrolysing)